MLKLSNLKAERIRRSVTIQGHEITFGLRGPDSLELIEVSRASTVTRDKMQAAKAEGRSYSASSEEMTVTIDGLSQLILDVTGVVGDDETVEVSWADLGQIERRELLAAIPMHQFWDLYNDVMTLDSLKDAEKNG